MVWRPHCEKCFSPMRKAWSDGDRQIVWHTWYCDRGYCENKSQLKKILPPEEEPKHHAG